MKQHSISPLPHQADSTYWAEKLRTLPHFVFLDSTNTDHPWDILVADPCQWLEVKGSESSNLEAQLLQLTDSMSGLNNVGEKEFESLPFTGGWLGYLSYEAGLGLNKVRTKNAETKSPYYLMQAGCYLWAILVNRKTKQSHLFLHSECPQEKIDTLQSALASEVHPKKPSFKLDTPFEAHINQAYYSTQLETIAEYIQAGDRMLFHLV